MKAIGLIVSILAISVLMGAIPFTEIDAGLTGLAIGSSAWCDLDGDGYPDIFLTGSPARYPNTQKITKIYRNLGNGTFSDTNAAIPGVNSSSVAFADYDSDGDQDILLTGMIGPYQPVSRIYRNDGGFAFTNIGAYLSGVEDGACAWGDYDNDGDQDIVIAGMVYDEYYISRIYRNDGNDTFTDIQAGLNGMGSGSVQWGDYDNDGDLDLLACGWDYFTKMATIYTNEGDDVFTDTQTGFTGVYRGSAAWLDVDHDDDLDVLLSGFTGMSCIMKLYVNDQGNYVETSAVFPASRGGDISLADFDRDNDQDILHWGFNGSSYVVQLYANDDNYNFTDLNGGFVSGWGSSTSWGDYDNDGDPDILISVIGADGNSVSRIYRNDTPPPAPNPVMEAEVSFDMQPDENGDVQLSWEPVTSDSNGNPINPSYYIILCSSSPENNGFEFLDYTTQFSYVHAGVSLSYDAMFYKVIAYAGDKGHASNLLEQWKQQTVKIKHGELLKTLGQCK